MELITISKKSALCNSVGLVLVALPHTHKNKEMFTVHTISVCSRKEMTNIMNICRNCKHLLYDPSLDKYILSNIGFKNI